LFTTIFPISAGYSRASEIPLSFMQELKHMTIKMIRKDKAERVMLMLLMNGINAVKSILTRDRLSIKDKK